MRHAKPIAAVLLYAALLTGFWLAARHFGVAARLGGRLGPAMASFALLFAPLWFFGFGAGEAIATSLSRSKVLLVLGAGALDLPYLVLAIPRHAVEPRLAVEMFLFPVVLAAFFADERLGPKLAWKDIVVLAAIAAAHYLRVFDAAWPYDGLGALPKLWLIDIVIYLYVVVRRLDGMGYDLVPQWSDLAVGLREWAFYLPFALGLGFAIHFIHLHRGMPTAGTAGAAYAGTFFLIALPEELYFRAVLQNLLETRLGRHAGLFVTAVLFGLSHFNKPQPFNWRYVILAAIAGVFYGRAWRAKRRVFASTITHATVDVVWSLWFR